MEIGTFILCVGGGLGVIVVGAYASSKISARKSFEANRERLLPLIRKINNEFGINEWTAEIVNINNNTLIKWWSKIVKKNANNEYKVKAELISILSGWGVDIEPIGEDIKINKNQAKKAFLSNLDKFAPLLPSLNNESFDRKLWTEMIVAINDFHLTELWKKYVLIKDTQEKWKRLLASWQIKSDDCKSFTCVRKDNILSYTLPNGETITMGKKYKVENACWVYTYEDQEGNTNKRIVSRGIVVPFQE